MKNQNTRPLRLALLGNAAFSTLSALILTFFSHSVASFIGASNHTILLLIGIGLGIFAADLFHQATRPRMQTWRALYASIGDASWVIGTVILLLWFPQLLNDQGKLLMVAIAGVITVFGCLQVWGAGEAHRIQNTKRYRHCVAVTVPENSHRVWDAVSDLSGISKYFPSLRSSFIRDGLEPQVGAIRQCEDQSGKQWAEKCTKFEPGKQIQMEFLCDEEGFPYPAKKMIGGWDLIQISETSTEVHIWWELQPKPAFMAPLILPLLGLKADIDFPPLVFRMASRNQPTIHAPTSLFRRMLLPAPSC